MESVTVQHNTPHMPQVTKAEALIDMMMPALDADRAETISYCVFSWSLKEAHSKDKEFQRDRFSEYWAIANLKNVLKPHDSACKPSECHSSREHLFKSRKCQGFGNLTNTNKTCLVKWSALLSSFDMLAILQRVISLILLSSHPLEFVLPSQSCGTWCA